MPNPIVLPYDPTGQAVTNKIPDEQQLVTPPTKVTDASVVVPKVGPFFKNGMTVKVGTPGNLTSLTLDVDYQLVYRHITLSHATGLDVYGGILFKNRNFTGSVWIDYQAIGEPFSLPDQSIVERFSRSLNNVMYVSFEQFAGLPSAWPSSEHPIDGENVTNMQNVSGSIDNVAAAINAQNSSSGAEPIAQAHIGAAIAHTPSQIGLGNLNNWPVASANDYTSGANSAYCNPFGVKNYVTTVMLSLGITALTTRVGNLETGLNSHTALIDSLTTQSTAFGTAITNIEHDVDDLDTRVNTNTTALNNLSALITDQATDYSNLLTQVNTNSSNIATLSSDLDDLDTRVGTAEDDIADLKNRVEDVEAIPTVAELSTAVTLNSTSSTMQQLSDTPTQTLTGTNIVGSLNVPDRADLLSGSFQLYQTSSFKIKLITGNYYGILAATRAVPWGSQAQYTASHGTGLVNLWVKYDDTVPETRITVEINGATGINIPYVPTGDDWLEIVQDGTELHWKINGTDVLQTPQNPLENWFNIYNNGDYGGSNPDERANILQYDLTGTVAYKEIALPNTTIVAGKYYHIDEYCQILNKSLIVGDYVQFFNNNAHAVIHKQ